ncbi:MAG: MFS transporter [Rubrivivax sp.]|nr:MFS transporter [Rubrivivax sp.]
MPRRLSARGTVRGAAGLAPSRGARLPAGVWLLGFVSLLMDVSSEMVHSLLPLFLVGTLGASMVAVGLIEGLAEATALIVKVFSGVLSDRLGHRKGLALLGYGIGALSKPAFALATGVGVVTAARFVDRVGKGIRGAPRDALLADLAPRGLRGAAFGLRQALDTAGALVGPAVAAALMWALHDDLRAVFWWALLPGLLAVALLQFGVREPAPEAAADGSATPRVNPLAGTWRGQLGAAYWWVVAVGAALTLARFSEAFLVLRAQGVGMALAVVPLVMVAMNSSYALSAYPFGRLGDRVDRRALLAAGLALLVLADLVLAVARTPAAVIVGVLLWGLHLGLTQGLLSAMVADAAPAALRGSAFGVFNLVSGLAMLVASVLAGLLWQQFGAAATFAAGGIFAALAFAGVLWRGPARAAGD